MMPHKEYVELFDQIVKDLKGEFVSVEKCENTVKGFRETDEELKVQNTKAETKLNIMIGILGAIGCAVIPTCISLLINH